VLDLVNFGDGVKILDQFLPVHADAAVDDGKRARPLAGLGPAF
jgi:hypothetical protein